MVDSVTFGMQLPDRSIGRLADGTWGLTTPTFGAANVALPTAKPSKMKINEWLASENVTSANDFIELYNGDTLPVNMGGMYLTDNPEDLPEEVYLGQQDPTTVTPPLAIPPLSFIDGATIDANGLDDGAYAVFKADATPSQGANHLAFKLRPFEGLIGLFDTSLNKIDQIFYGPQTTDVSEGRNPLGDSTYSTETIPTPGIENTGTTNIGGSTNTTTTHPIASYAQSLDILLPEPGRHQRRMDRNRAYVDSAWAYRARSADSTYRTNADPRPHGRQRTQTTAARPVPRTGYPYATYYFRTHFTWSNSLRPDPDDAHA